MRNTQFNECIKITLAGEYSNSRNALHKLRNESTVTYKGLYRKANTQNIIWKLIDEKKVALLGNSFMDKPLYILDHNDLRLLSKHLVVSNFDEIEDRVHKSFKNNYWDKSKLDLCNSKSKSLSIFDFGVNVGSSRANKIVQKMLNLVVDGKIGKISIKAINSMDSNEFLNLFLSKKKKFYEDLAVRKPHLRRYVTGWFNRANRIHKLCIKNLLAGTN